MDILIELSWKAYPAMALIVFGVVAVVWAMATAFGSFGRSARSRGDLLTVLGAFRVWVVGLAIAGIGISWALDLTWLFVLSAVFGGEELLESSVVIWVLRRRFWTGAAYT